MKFKKILSLFITAMLCMSAFAVYAEDAGNLLIMPSPQKNITVMLDDDILSFDVEPIIQNGRTLVPFRVIFEKLGCEVGYNADENGKGTVTARRGDEVLMLGINDSCMYLNGDEFSLDVPAIIKDDRTLVPLRAVSEALNCEVLWDETSRTVSIYKPAGHFDISYIKLEEEVVNSDGDIIIEAVAFYPLIDNTSKIPFVDEINGSYKWNAEKFISDALNYKDDAQCLLEEMGKENFVPFKFSLTYVEEYNVYGVLSITDYAYMNTGGVHPTVLLDTKNYIPGSEEELSLSHIIDEKALDDGLYEFVYNHFAAKLEEMDIEADSDGRYKQLEREVGDLRYRLTGNSLVMYFNQGQIAPYALGIISVEIPYDETLFLVGLDNALLDEYIIEAENDDGFEWRIVDYSKDKITVDYEYTAYNEEDLLSEYYPVGMNKFTIKGISKGNAKLTLAHVEEGKELTEARAVRIISFYVDENNKLTIVTESDDVSVFSK